MNSSFFEKENIQSKRKKRLSWTAKYWFKSHASVKIYEVSDVKKLWNTEITSKVKKIILDLLRPIDKDHNINIRNVGIEPENMSKYEMGIQLKPKSYLLCEKYEKEILDGQKKYLTRLDRK